jgi:excisionase family DNA binding protein
MSTVTQSLFGIAEVAARLGVSPFTIRRLINSGKLHSVTVGTRRLVPLDQILLAEQGGVGTPRKSARTAEQIA